MMNSKRVDLLDLRDFRIKGRKEIYKKCGDCDLFEILSLY